MQGVPLDRPSGVALLLRVVDRVLACVDVDRPRNEERRRLRVLAEAADVELPHVVARLAVDDPLGCVAPGAAREDDAEDAEAGEHVEIAQTRHGPHQAAAVGGVAVGAVDDRLDAGGAEGGQTRGCVRECGFETVEVGRQEPRMKAVLDVPRPRVALERPDEQAGSLLPYVEGAVRVAEDRQLQAAAPSPPESRR